MSLNKMEKKTLASTMTSNHTKTKATSPTRPNVSYTDIDDMVFNYMDGIQFFIGFIFNLLVFVVCMRKKLRKTTTFWFIAFISLSNTLIFAFHSLPLFLNQIYGQHLEFQSLAWCKIATYFEIVSYNTSSWFLVSLILYLNFFLGLEKKTKTI